MRDAAPLILTGAAFAVLGVFLAPILGWAVLVLLGRDEEQ